MCASLSLTASFRALSWELDMEATTKVYRCGLRNHRVSKWATHSGEGDSCLCSLFREVATPRPLSWRESWDRFPWHCNEGSGRCIGGTPFLFTIQKWIQTFKSLELFGQNIESESRKWWLTSERSSQKWWLESWRRWKMQKTGFGR